MIVDLCCLLTVLTQDDSRVETMIQKRFLHIHNKGIASVYS
jgi:hypothetical protein